MFTKKWPLALVIVMIIGLIVATCLYLWGHTQNSLVEHSKFTAQQKDQALQIIKDSSLYDVDLSGAGELESFNFSRGIYHTSSNLVLVPIMSNDGKNVTEAWLVDLDNNKTVGHFAFPQDYYSYDKVKTLINITLNAPIVIENLHYIDFDGINVDYSGYLDSASKYVNWSGRFINVQITMIHTQRLIPAIIDDTIPRVIEVNELVMGTFGYNDGPTYAIIPPGKEKYVYLIPYPFYTSTAYPNMWWTKVMVEPQDAKVYPVIFEEKVLNTITNSTSENALDTSAYALAYKDFMTNNTRLYDGSQAVSSGWSANISLDRDTNVYLSLKNTGDKDVQVEVNIVPDRDMVTTLTARYGLK